MRFECNKWPLYWSNMRFNIGYYWAKWGKTTATSSPITKLIVWYLQSDVTRQQFLLRLASEEIADPVKCVCLYAESLRYISRNPPAISSATCKPRDCWRSEVRVFVCGKPPLYLCGLVNCHIENEILTHLLIRFVLFYTSRRGSWWGSIWKISVLLDGYWCT